MSDANYRREGVSYATAVPRENKAIQRTVASGTVVVPLRPSRRPLPPAWTSVVDP